jgi:hypothetical protein
LWVSILGFGVYRVDDGIWSRIEILKGEPDITAYAMLGDAKGRIWLAYPERKKVGLWDNGAIRIFSEDDGLTIGPVDALAGSAGQIWAGGEMGVAYFRNGRFHTLEPADGSVLAMSPNSLQLPNMVYGLAAPRQSYMSRRTKFRWRWNPPTTR